MTMEPFLPLFKEAANFFIFTMVELALLFVGISFLVGVINEFMPKEKVQQWLSGRHGKGYIIGSLMGSVTPFCSCSTIPFTVGLLRANAGFGPTMAFLFTSPLVNPIIIPLFLTLLGVKITVVYAVAAITLAIGISYSLEQLGFQQYIKNEALQPKTFSGQALSEDSPLPMAGGCCDSPQPIQMASSNEPIPCCGPADSGSVSPQAIPMTAVAPNRWKRIFEDAVGQYRKLLPFIILGVALGSIIHGFLPADLVTRLAGSDNPLAIPVSAVIGIPLYLRVSTMVPIAASLIAKGMSIGAVIALIIGGAGASIPEVAMLRGLFTTRLLAAFVGSVLLIATITGLMMNLVVN